MRDTWEPNDGLCVVCVFFLYIFSFFAFLIISFDRFKSYVANNMQNAFGLIYRILRIHFMPCRRSIALWLFFFFIWFEINNIQIEQIKWTFRIIAIFNIIIWIFYCCKYNDDVQIISEISIVGHCMKIQVFMFTRRNGF